MAIATMAASEPSAKEQLRSVLARASRRPTRAQVQAMERMLVRDLAFLHDFATTGDTDHDYNSRITPMLKPTEAEWARAEAFLALNDATHKKVQEHYPETATLPEMLKVFAQLKQERGQPTRRTHQA